MGKITTLNNLFKTQEGNSFTSKSKLLDRTGNFYHVTQQGYNYSSIFNVGVAKYRTHMMYNLCENNNVIPLCNVIMPNHTHDVFYSEDFSNISKVMRLLNSLTSKSVEKDRIMNGKKNYEPVYMTLPSYERISEKDHLFFLFKYLYDNPKQMKQEQKFVPFSCFDMWEKNYFKPYKEEAYKILFGKTLEEITQMCISMNKEQFMSEAKKLFGNQKV